MKRTGQRWQPRVCSDTDPSTWPHGFTSELVCWSWTNFYYDTKLCSPEHGPEETWRPWEEETWEYRRLHSQGKMNWKGAFYRNIKWNTKNICKARTNTQLKFSQIGSIRDWRRRKGSEPLRCTSRDRMAAVSGCGKSAQEELAWGCQGSQEQPP